MTTTLTQMPPSFRAGTTVTYTRSDPDYPASAGWTLKCYLRGTAETDKLDLTGVAVGDSWTVTATAALTAAFGEGTYKWVEQVSLSGTVYVLDEGTVIVEPLISGVTDSRSYARRMLDAIRTVREGTAPENIQSMQLAGRALVRYTPKELADLEREFQARVLLEITDNAGGTPAQVVFRPIGPDASVPYDWPWNAR